MDIKKHHGLDEIYRGGGTTRIRRGAMRWTANRRTLDKQMEVRIRLPQPEHETRERVTTVLLFVAPSPTNLLTFRFYGLD